MKEVLNDLVKKLNDKIASDQTYAKQQLILKALIYHI